MSLRLGMITLALAISSWAYAQEHTAAPATQEQQDRQRLSKALAESVLPVTRTSTAHGGAGGEWLRAQTAAADIVMIGEMHGVADIARMAQEMARTAAANGTTIYVTEIGPWAAQIFEPLLQSRGPDFEIFMSDARRAASVPFLNLREDAEIARALLQRDDAAPTALWGLDQEFLTAGPLLLDRLEDLARTPNEREAVSSARKVIVPVFMALAKIPAATFGDLRQAFAAGSANAKALIEAMAVSHQIYAAQGYASNCAREELMKRTFLTYWRAAKAASGGKPPKLLMKFGAYHLTAGLTPTMVPSLGSYVRTLADLDQQSVFSVFLMCGPDGQQILFDGTATSCKGDFDEAASSLAGSLLGPDSRATVIRTAPLRAISGTLRRLGFGENMRNYIFSYDALVIINAAQAAQPFTPPDPAFFAEK